jgi:hypothetical protein
MDNEKKQKRNRMYALLIRWWAVGAVFFFIGWGTSLGSYTSMIDFTLILGIAIGIINSMVVDRVVFEWFSIGKKQKYLDVTIMQKVSDRLLSVVVSIFIVYLVSVLYTIINVNAIEILGKSDEFILLPVEPILFALFYIIIHDTLRKVLEVVIHLVKNNVKK